MEPVCIANFFLKKAKQEDIPVTQLKLLKLVYIGYGWVAAVLDRQLFDEPIEAWQHGPVVNSLYHEFKHYGRDPITTLGVSFDLEREQITYPDIPEDEEDIRFILTFVWDIYKRYSAWALREKTHEENTPWHQTYYDKGATVIPYELIKEHFHDKIMEYLE